MPTVSQRRKKIAVLSQPVAKTVDGISMVNRPKTEWYLVYHFSGGGFKTLHLSLITQPFLSLAASKGTQLRKLERGCEDKVNALHFFIYPFKVV